MKFTPRQYLSWSSMDLFERNPKQWIRVYFYGEKSPTNRGMDFGKTMAEALENGDLTGDPVLDIVMERLPKFEIMDKVLQDPNGDEVDYFDPALGKTIKVKLPVLKGKGYRIPILAKPDTMKADGTGFNEYKTGQEPWTKEKANRHGQIDFYGTAFFLKNGFIPGNNKLVWVETGKTGNGAPDAKIGATGGIHEFNRTITMAQALKMMVRMKKAWEGMQKTCESEMI